MIKMRVGIKQTACSVLTICLALSPLRQNLAKTDRNEHLLLEYEEHEIINKQAKTFLDYSVTQMELKRDNAAKDTSQCEKCYTEIDKYKFNEDEVGVLAKTVYGEARGIQSDTEKAAVVWCILNRVDDGRFGEDIISVTTAKFQFAGYSSANPIDESIEAIVKDVLERWYREKDGETDVGRILPDSYLYFHGDGKRNYFSEEWEETTYWDWSLDSPYEN